MDVRAARSLLLLVAVLGVAGDLLFDRALLGVNLPIAVMGVLAIVTIIGRRRSIPDRADWWLPIVAAAAALVVALRTDGVVVLLDTILAVAATAAWSFAAGGVAVTRRSLAVVTQLGALALGAFVTGAATIASRAAVGASLGRALDGVGRFAPALRGILIAAPVAIVFAALLASADAVFARLASQLLTTPIDPTEGLHRSAVSLVLAWFAAGFVAMAAGLVGPPATTPSASGAPGPLGADASARTPGAPRRASTEVVILLATLDVLFALFVALQVAYLFGGADTLAATGMPYSTYARQGYFQLVAVVVLAGLVLMVANAVTPRTQRFVALALGLVGLAGLILVSAAVRLGLYLQAYGWTELRFYVGASIVWLAITGVLAVTLLLWARMRWLPHGAAIAAIAVTLGISALGPQAFVTGENIARVLDPTRVPADGFPGLDTTYLLTLDDDAVPMLVESLGALAPDDRAAVLGALEERRDRLRALPREWTGWNWSRERARATLEQLPAG